MITEPQQRRYHALIDKARDFLRAKNTDDGTGVSYSDVEDIYFQNYDEECLQVSNGKVKIIGAAGRR